MVDGAAEEADGAAEEATGAAEEAGDAEADAEGAADEEGAADDFAPEEAEEDGAADDFSAEEEAVADALELPAEDEAAVEEEAAEEEEALLTGLPCSAQFALKAESAPSALPSGQMEEKHFCIASLSLVQKWATSFNGCDDSLETLPAQASKQAGGVATAWLA